MIQLIWKQLQNMHQTQRALGRQWRREGLRRGEAPAAGGEAGPEAAALPGRAKLRLVHREQMRRKPSGAIWEPRSTLLNSNFLLNIFLI